MCGGFRDSATWMGTKCFQSLPSSLPCFPHTSLSLPHPLLHDLMLLHSLHIFFPPPSLSCSPVSSLHIPMYLLPPTSCHATIPSSHKYTYIPFPSLALLLTPPPPSLPPPPHLNASWSPRYELSQLPLPDALQALVDLGGVHFPLDDVQDGDVAVVVSTITWS